MKQENVVPLGITTAFYVLGICTLLPWNFFITADQFWQYKLRDTSSANWTSSGLTGMQISFLPTLGAISNTLNLVFTIIASLMTIKVGDKWRIFGSLWTSLLAMAAITFLAIVNTDNWQEMFYGIALTLISILTVGIAIMQTSLYGLAGTFPSLCITALFSGQAISGIVSSVAMLVSLAIGNADPLRSGITYFLMADVFLCVSLLAYWYLVRSETYSKVNDFYSQNQTDREKPKIQSYISIFRNIKWLGLTAAVCLFVTLSVFPAVQVYISSTNDSSVWTNVYFQPTITFLLFNVFDFVGREACRVVQWPKADGWRLHAATALRIILVPLIMFCYGENKGFPTLFYNDAFYIIFNMLLGFTNGYVLSLLLIYYTRLVKESEVELAGTVMGCMMSIGLTLGSAVSPLMVSLWAPRN